MTRRTVVTTLVVVMALAVGFGTGWFAHEPGSVTRRRSEQTGAVPWVNRPAPAFTPSPPPPTYPSGPPCSASALKPSGTAPGAGAGQAFLRVFFRNISSSPCELLGYPKLLGVEPGGALIPLHASHEGPYFANSTGAAPVGSLIAVNLVGSDSCTRQGSFKTLRLVLPSGAYVALGAPSWIECGIGLSRLGIPNPAELGHVEGSPLRVHLVAPPVMASSSTLRYTVRITNTADHPYALEPCPSYREYIYVLPGAQGGAKPALTDQTYYLNCDSVSKIPPHRTVPFSMVIDVPSGSGDAKFAWILDVTGSPAPGAAIRVAPSK